MGENVFDAKKLNKLYLECSYIIGTDTFNGSSAYCLVRKSSKGTDVLLCKTIHNDKEKFEEEVNNLAKYFNATRVVEKP